MMAEPPSWMTMSEIDGGWTPYDVVDDYGFLENAGVPWRHRQLFNMLIRFPAETLDSEVSEEQMDFYLHKTGSLSAEHLRDKVMRYGLASNAERANEEYMLDLIKLPTTTDEAEGVAAAQVDVLAPLQQAASSPHARRNEAARKGDEACPVSAEADEAANESASRSPHEAEGDANVKVEADEAAPRAHAEAEGKEPWATARETEAKSEVASKLPLKRKASVEAARDDEDEEPMDKEKSVAAAQASVPAPVQQAASSPHARRNEAAGNEDARKEDEERPVSAETGAEPAGAGAAGEGATVANATSATVDAPPVTDANDVEMSLPSPEEVVADAVKETKHGDGKETAGAEPAGVGAAGAGAIGPTASATVEGRGVAAAQADVPAPVQQAASSPHARRNEAAGNEDARKEDEERPVSAETGVEPAGAGAAGEGATVASDELRTEQSTAEPSAERSSANQPAVDEGRAGSTDYTIRCQGYNDNDDDEQRRCAFEWELESRARAEEARNIVELAAAAQGDSSKIQEEVGAKVDANSGFRRISDALDTHSLSNPIRNPSTINLLMALKARDCTEPSVAAQPSDPSRTAGDLKWLQVHHEGTNLSGPSSKWQLNLVELGLMEFFEQELFAGIGTVRSGSPMVLVSSPVCVFKDGAAKLRSQGPPILPGSLININLLSNSTKLIRHAMLASVMKLEFEQVMLRNVGTHCYQVVTFLQLFTHAETYLEDEQWLLATHAKLVPLLTKPAALLLGFAKPRQLLLAMVEDLLPVEKRNSQPTLIVKEGNKAIRAMLREMVGEEREKGEADNTYKMLFGAPLEPMPPRQSLMAKMQLLDDTQWAIQSHSLCISAMHPRAAGDAAPPISDPPPSSQGSSSTSTRRVSKKDSHETAPAAMPLSIPRSCEASSEHLTLDEIDRLSDDLGISPSGNLMDPDLLKHVKRLISRVRMSIKKVPGSLSPDAATKALMQDAAAKTMISNTSTVLNNVISAKLTAMALEITAARCPLRKERLEEIKVRATEYATNAIEAISMMHDATLEFRPSYTPQRNRAKQNITNWCDVVVNAAEAALATLLPKAQDAVQDTPRKVPKVPKKSKLLPDESSILPHSSSSRTSSLATLPSATVGDRATLATVTHWNLEDVEEKNSAQLRSVEAEANAREEGRKRRLAESEAARAKMQAEENKKVADRATAEYQRVQQELNLKNAADKAHKDHLVQMDKLRSSMSAQSEELRSRLEKANLTLAHHEGSKETELVLRAQLDQAKTALASSQVQEALFRGAMMATMPALGGAGPSGASPNQMNLNSLLMPPPPPPTRPSLMPPPPPPLPRKMLQLQHSGSDTAESNMPPDLQRLIVEIQEAEDNASRPSDTSTPRYGDANACLEWKAALRELAKEIATLRALDYELGKAKRYGEAEVNLEKLKAVEATLEENMSMVRAWLDSLPHPT